MVSVTAWLSEIPDRGLFPIRIPPVLTRLHPTKEHRLMLPLIRRTAEYEGILDPDAAPGEIEACLDEGAAEVQAFSVSVKT